MRFSRAQYVSEKYMIFGVVIIFFVCVVLLFMLTGDQRIEDRMIGNKSLPSVSPSSAEQNYQNQTGPAVHVQEEMSNYTSVRYMNDSFSPSEITIKNETGCFIEIQNKSNQDVTPRLGPHDPRKEQGFPYPSIAPGANSLLDPRHSASSLSLLYNKNNPSATFIVHIDPTCL